MSAKLLEKVSRFRKKSSTQSWETYLGILGTVIRSNRVKTNELTELYELLKSRKFAEALDFADCLALQKQGSAAEHFAVNQFVSLVKKYPFPNSEDQLDPEGKAREAFAASETYCSEVNKRFRSCERFLSIEYSEMRAWIRYVLGDNPPLNSIYNECTFGPGASVGVHGNATHLAKKYLSKWSVSPSAYHYARAALHTDDHVFELLTRGMFHQTVFGYDVRSFDLAFNEKCVLVSHNKIAFVPKTAKTHRSIAVEPLLNSYLQKGTDLFMRKRLKRVGIDLTDQSVNSELARLGSLADDDNSYVTIDLKSASDSISIGLCEELLPTEWFRFLDSIRSKNYLVDNSEIEYHKFCSMGNGFCFPLETLLFAAACKVVTKGTAPVDFCVYGDDIVVKKRHAEALLALLGDMGFQVNTSKTFLQGSFRESCGRDWFGGEDVRPFMLDFALDSLENHFKFLNLTCRNTRSSVYFDEIRSVIFERIPSALRLVRPFSGNDDTAITVPLDEFMSSPFARWSSTLQCWSWRELHHDSVRDNDWRRDARQDIVLMMAAVRGCSSNKPFTFRRKTKTRVRSVAHACYT